MSGSSKSTTDHEEIKGWAEARCGRPTIVKGAEGRGEGKEASLEPVSWDEFFRTFDEKHLSFLYQDRTADGKESRFFKFVNRE